MDTWLDPRTLIGVAGVLFALISFLWNRRESRLDALSDVLQPMVRAAQHLHDANLHRKKCERLKASFPDPQDAPEAAQRVKQMFDRYNSSIHASEEQFRLAEAEFASKSFRFPDRVTRLVKTVQDTLSEYGRLVNEGLFDQADLQFARFRDDYKLVTAVGRGWRLADPFEGIRKRIAREKPETTSSDDLDLSEHEMNRIMELVHKRVTTQAGNTFAVHPPKKLLGNSKLVESDKVIEELQDAIFVVAFQDGTSQMLSLIELMVFVYNLIFLAVQHKEVSQIMGAFPPETGDVNVKVSFRFSIPELMRPEMVKALLSKITFSDTPSD